jgi:hypothetical protein
MVMKKFLPILAIGAVAVGAYMLTGKKKKTNAKLKRTTKPATRASATSTPSPRANPQTRAILPNAAAQAPVSNILNPQNRINILDIIGAFESGLYYDYSGDYGYGLLQANVGDGEVIEILKQYANQGQAKPELKKEVNALLAKADAQKTLEKQESTYAYWMFSGDDSTQLDVLWYKLTDDPIFLMLQENYFTNKYITPAEVLAAKLGYKKPASVLILADALAVDKAGFDEDEIKMLTPTKDQPEDVVIDKFLSSRMESEPYTNVGYEDEKYINALMARAEAYKQIFEKNPNLDKPITIQASDKEEPPFVDITIPLT